ncbi:MAG: hypothetical protein ABSC90_10480 [Acidimicrobiales bacterium]
MCGGRSRLPFAVCFCCSELVRQLRMPLVPVVATSTYRLGDELHRHLRGYKDAAAAEARAAHVAVLADRIGPWLADQGRLCPQLGSTWDVLTTVPSTRRPSGDPVGAVIAAVAGLDRLRAPLLVRGPDPTDHLVASRHGFELTTSAHRVLRRGARVLVVDDSIVTGARAQSAAAALRLRHAHVAGILALGRVVGPAPGADG